MKWSFTLLLFFVVGIANGQGTLVTVAGTGVPGFSGDGGDAKLSKISTFSQTCITTDALGNVYFTDQRNYRIRRIDRATGKIGTIAGNGGTGYTGDSGPAVAAEINNPRYLDFDWKGNLLFVDTANCRIRSISPSGVINYWGGTTCGDDGDGGNVTSAKLRSNVFVTGDSGKIYTFGDWHIRLVDSKGVIKRIAGTTYGYSGDTGPALSAQISGISGMAVNNNGYLFFGDATLARRVRYIDSKGMINTVVGNGSATPSGDGGKAISAGLGGYLYGLAFDQFGNMFIAANYRIRKIDINDSVISTIAGTGVAGYSGEGVDAKTHTVSATLIHFDTAFYELYFADSARIRKITNLVKPVSVKETAKTYTAEIFPVPATTKIHVSGIPIRSEIWIYDLLGREQYHSTMQEMEVAIDVSGFAPGTYILRASTPKGQEVHSKFLKQ